MMEICRLDIVAMHKDLRLGWCPISVNVKGIYHSSQYLLYLVSSSSPGCLTFFIQSICYNRSLRRTLFTFIWYTFLNSFSLSLSLLFSLMLSTILDSLHVHHMYAVFSHVTYLLSHVYNIHMLTNFTCQPLSHAYHFISSTKYRCNM